jgi:hypothetical protein
MQCLAVADGTISTVELERYRTRPIEVDDTACMRIGLADGGRVVVAVTLCGEDFIAGEIEVHGREGRAVLEYPTDRLTLPGDARPRSVEGRISLLDNLLDHRERPDEVALIAPLGRTEPFTALMEVIASAPDPTAVPPEWFTVTGQAPERHTVIRGVNAAVREATGSLSLFSEIGVAWAVPPYQVSYVDGEWIGVALQTGGGVAS